MVYIIYGVLGALLGLAVCGGCVWLGWRARGKFTERLHQTSEQELGEREREMLIEQQRAFQALMNYSPEIAYGTEPQDGRRDEE